MAFDKRQTAIAKGVAVLLLLWHHLFSAVDYNLYKNILFIKGVPAEAFIAPFCKVCVAIFLFLSGYGLNESWKSKMQNGDIKEIKAQVVFVKNHLLKLTMNYWLVYILFIVIGIAFGIDIWQKYDGNILYAVIDFLGLAFLFNSPTINPTWWFMSTIIVFYVFFPVFKKINDYCSEILLLIGFSFLFFPFLNLPALTTYHLFSFVLGMYISHNMIFDRIVKRIESISKRIIFSALFFYSGFMLAYLSYDLNSCLAVSIVFISFLMISKIPIINSIILQLGKYSGPIFMFHSFFLMYLQKYVYYFKYSPIIFIVFVAVCYITAVGLNYFKKIIRYDRLVKRLTK